MLETAIFQCKLFSLARTLRGSTVDDHDVGYLLQLDIEGQSFSFDVMEVAMTHEVAVALVLLVVEQLHDQARIRLEQLLVPVEGLKTCEEVPRCSGLRLSLSC